MTATGADCVIDVPIVYDGQLFTFYPDSSSDTLIFSNDLISVKGAYDYRPHFKNTVRFRDGVFGTTKTDSNLFPGIDGAQVWFEDDVKVDPQPDAAALVDIRWRMSVRSAVIDHVFTRTAVSPQHRDIYRTYVLEGVSVKETAARFGVTEAFVRQVKTRIGRMIAALEREYVD